MFEAISSYQTYLKDITKKMKSLAAELNMHHAQLNDYKDEIGKTSHDLNEAKRRYFDQKRRNQLFKDSLQTGLVQQ